MLHDIGKIGVSDDILLKPGPLTDEQWKKMKMHPEKGFELISQIPNMESAAQIIYCHEERYDGSGYPRNLKKRRYSSRCKVIYDN
ncbi:HD-GYP domain-containing protein [methane-oxidizing endosymbiont of Gigantopelta aegis]|uniref:HD-GYP domain-containing protein n=1 Tax=methane-oxidizing endosymbiont of Gigantopelta aegis TaxID=2794938 RepID=UPI001FDA44A5|nr:HD domain-containing phosphohydrolase [methane-oxidizing endosymbiont of Gigantopelta aegis]